jgi:hypothetical protein
MAVAGFDAGRLPKPVWNKALSVRIVAPACDGSIGKDCCRVILTDGDLADVLVPLGISKRDHAPRADARMGVDVGRRVGSEEKEHRTSGKRRARRADFHLEATWTDTHVESVVAKQRMVKNFFGK